MQVRIRGEVMKIWQVMWSNLVIAHLDTSKDVQSIKKNDDYLRIFSKCQEFLVCK
jgi:hypothetical protein